MTPEVARKLQEAQAEHLAHLAKIKEMAPHRTRHRTERKTEQEIQRHARKVKRITGNESPSHDYLIRQAKVQLKRLPAKQPKYDTLKARVEALEARYNRTDAQQLIQDLREPAKGGKRYRQLLNRARNAGTRKQKKEADPYHGLRSAAPRGLTRSPELTGGTHTVSGGHPGTKR